MALKSGMPDYQDPWVIRFQNDAVQIRAVTHHFFAEVCFKSQYDARKVKSEGTRGCEIAKMDLLTAFQKRAGLLIRRRGLIKKIIEVLGQQRSPFGFPL